MFADANQWRDLIDEVKINESAKQAAAIHAPVSPPLTRTTSTHAEVAEHSKEKSFTFENDPVIQEEPKQISKIRKNSRQRSSSMKSFTQVTESTEQSNNFQNRRRQRSNSINISDDWLEKRRKQNQKYSYNPFDPGFAFGTAKRNLQAKPKPVPPPGTYAPKIGIGHNNTKQAKFCSKSRRFGNNSVGSTPANVGPGMYMLPSSFNTNSFNSKAGRRGGGTFGTSKRMNYKHGKNPNAANYYPKYGSDHIHGSVVSKASRFANPSKTEKKNRVPVGSYNIVHIVNHDKQVAVYPVTKKTIASKI